MLRVPLHREFRYIHEPLPAGDPAIPLLGHEALVGALQERLTYSHGGAFLVSGFRGVGKSTLVLRALAATREVWGSRDAMLVVHLNVARSMTTDQLLFAVVRRIFETLDDRDLFVRLPREVQRSLLLAYSRTSLSFTQTQSESSERGAALGIAPPGKLAPTMNFSGRRTRSQATEAAFLAYSETDVEHDLIRIVHLLAGIEGRSEQPAASRRLVRLARRLRLVPGQGRRRETGRLRVHPVVVLDEVDKLTDNRDEAIVHFEGLLGRIKNVLTARGAHFIVVAGPDLHDRAIQDADRGNGVYESVFGWRMYVPCLWDAPERLVRGLAAAGREDRDPATRPPPPAPAPTAPSAPASPDAPPVPALAGPDPGTGPADDDPPVDRLIGYLRFKARGVPRRLLQEFNSLVVWQDGLPSLLVDDAEWERIDFYADLEAVVSRATAARDGDGPRRVAVDDDRVLLGGYHVVDWALRSQGRPFTSADVTGSQGVDPLLRMAPSAVERTLRRLAREGVLDVVSEPGRPDATRYGRAASALAYYKLADAYRRQLAGFVRASESERADLGIVAPQPAAGDTFIGAPSARTDPPGSASLLPAPPTGIGAGRGSGPDPWTGPADDGPADDARRADPPDTDPPEGPAAPRAASARTPAVGVLAGRYEMSRLLGQGGMGAVYRGRDVLTGQPVAVKVMHGSVRDAPDMLARFEREVRISRALNHPHIVHTLDAHIGGDAEPALIMELVEGPSLVEVLSEYGAIPPPLVARLGRQLGEALAFIHGLGVSRIDLKPSNVLLHPQRGAVVIDLGIAKPTEETRDELTEIGVVIGTPGYMSPEQARGGRADIRTDLYTLGLILHQCLTGRPVWDVRSTAELIHLTMHQDVPVDTLPASGPLKELIGRLGASAPEHRPQSPAEFLALLADTPEARDEVGGGDDILSALRAAGPTAPPGPLPPIAPAGGAEATLIVLD